VDYLNHAIFANIHAKNGKSKGRGNYSIFGKSLTLQQVLKL